MCFKASLGISGKGDFGISGEAHLGISGDRFFGVCRLLILGLPDRLPFGKGKETPS